MGVFRSWVVCSIGGWFLRAVEAVLRGDAAVVVKLLRGRSSGCDVVGFRLGVFQPSLGGFRGVAEVLWGAHGAEAERWISSGGKQRQQWRSRVPGEVLD